MIVVEIATPSNLSCIERELIGIIKFIGVVKIGNLFENVFGPKTE